MDRNELIPNLFRTEFGKIVAVICKTYGLKNIQFAEDVVSDAFLVASETWSHKGVPDNPKAWLYKVSKNKALDQFKRSALFQSKILPEIKASESASDYQELDLSDQNIEDSQLRMLFAVCHPTLKKEAQIALALRVLCGFGISEIADAFLSNKETINKRLVRVKKEIREKNIDIEFPPENELESRLDNVLLILYLIFNEGYYSSSSETKLKKDLCADAMRLAFFLTKFNKTNGAKTNALLALFCFHSSRFEARIDSGGNEILYEDQDRKLWDNDLIQQGEYFLSRSSTGNEVSKFHLEAMIAFWHTQEMDEAIKWENILQSYNRLLQLNYNPIVALNRTYALAQVMGNKAALIEAKKISLDGNLQYHLLLAELEESESEKIRQYKLALDLASSENEKNFIKSRMV